MEILERVEQFSPFESERCVRGVSEVRSRLETGREELKMGTGRVSDKSLFFFLWRWEDA